MPTMTSSSLVAGVCLVRNAADLIAYTCGHYLRIGFDRLTFLDDGSTDRTFEVLERISAKTDRVAVLRVDRFAHDRENQAELITSAVNELIDGGINIIIPFDADEFWNLTAELARNIAARHQEGLFVGQMLNFVQDRRVVRPHPFSLLRVRYRSPVLAGVEPASVRAYEVPLFARAPTKVGLKSHQPVQVGRGNHRLLQGPTNILLTNLEVFHIPLRAESEITRRAQDYGPRVLPRRSGTGESWHLEFIHDEVQAGRLAQLWAANSADRNGALVLGNDTIPLLRDHRFRQLIFKAARYMTLQHKLPNLFRYY